MTLINRYCKHCEEIITGPSTKKFCNAKCKTRFHKKSVKPNTYIECLNCSTTILMKRKDSKFCNLKCGNSFRYKQSDRTEYSRQYYKLNKEKINKRHVIYFAKKLKSDKLFKFKHNIRTLLRNSFTKYKFSKNSKSEKILGCTFETLQQHLNQSFCENYKRDPCGSDNLHVDHIVPLYTAKTEYDIIKLNHYTNLRWLLAKDNLQRSRK